MENRTIEIKFRLNKKEADALNKRVKKSGLSREGYIRQLLSGYIPADLPPPDYYAMMNELRAVGGNMNQIAQKAHVLGVIDVKRYDEAFTLLKESLVGIVKAVTSPRRISAKGTELPYGTLVIQDNGGYHRDENNISEVL